MAVEKRRSHGWQAFGSYTLSRAYGLQPSSGATAAGAQVSTVAPPPAPRPHLRARSERSHQRARPAAQRSPAHVPRDGQRRRAANRLRGRRQPAVLQRQAVGGDGAGIAAAEHSAAARPARAAWLAPAVVANAARSARVEDDRASAALGRIELLFDVLNVLNDTAEEGLATDNLFSPNFGQPTVVHGSAARDGRREAEPGSVAVPAGLVSAGGVTASFGSSIRTMSEFWRERSNTICLPSGVMSNVLKVP